MSDDIQLGSWRFSPSTGSLSREDETVRLEVRAASLLDVLCAQAGKPVSLAEIIDRVWDGRSVSPNSVAVVIADIRKALGDDARRPQYIETLPKRGYRVIAPVSQTGAPAGKTTLTASGALSRRKTLLLGGLVAAAVISLILILPGNSGRKGMTVPLQPVSVLPTENATEDEGHDALATALTEVVLYKVSRRKGLMLVGSGEAGIELSSRLILWNGQESLSLDAVSPEGESLWKGIAPGPAERLPRQVAREIRKLDVALAQQAEAP